ncbi:MAG: hypothetical protein JXR22_04550 [Prolixibacteraceae bacterium]|nr:hypothetical protein [Prolixibacteraceae bacterium]
MQISKVFLLEILLIPLLINSLGLSGQNNYHLQISAESLHSNAEHLPFWLTANQQAIYTTSHHTQQLLLIDGSYRFKNVFHSPLSIETGALLTGSRTNSIDLNAYELYAKMFLWGWKLEGGWFAEPDFFGGLSSTNGNLDRSNNARPYPRIRFGTDDFIPFLFWKDWFSFKAEYDEGWLNDQRYVTGTRLHHKSLYGRVSFPNQSVFTIGLNHYVMWGGVSPGLGPLPDEFQDYLIYITGSTGNDRFPVTDQFNVAGNQFGSYHLQYDLPLGNATLSFFINHLFEDHSGMELKNISDNLYGLYADFGKAHLIEAVMYEFMYTKHQGGDKHVQGSTGLDNYYNHGVYQSGYSYQGMMMVSPLFNPVNMVDGMIRGITNNRIVMHHLGWKGQLLPVLSWEGKLTFSQNFGTYSKPFDPQRNQFSGLLGLHYSSVKFPLDLSISLATDQGQHLEKRSGFRIGISKTF